MEPENPVQPAVQNKPVPQHIDIRSQAKEDVKDAGEFIKHQLINDRVKKELVRREEAAAKVLEKIEALEADEKKTDKPTFAGYTAEGKPVGEPMYTQEQVKQLKEIREKKQKYEAALEKALTENDFSKVFELSKQ